jgi:hypothetical protein
MMRALLSVGILVAAPVMAQAPAEPSCANIRVALPSEFSGWSAQTPVSAGTKAGEGAALEMGRAALVSLHSAKHLDFAAPKATADANGGTLAIAVAKPGTYRVALGGSAWVDLVQDGKPVASKAHGHGPRCSGIRKIVDFALEPGNYTIQLSGSADDTVALMVVRV